MRLGDLLHGIAAPEQGGIMVSGLTQDSHAVKAGDAFVALQGARTHGIEFAEVAVAQGAVAVLAEKSGLGTRDSGLGKAEAAPSTAIGSAFAPASEPNASNSRTAALSSPESRVPGPEPGVPSPGSSPSPESRVPGPGPGVPSPAVWIEDLRSHLGAIASRFFHDPSASLTVIGVTGTNGKTSTVQLLAQAFAQLGERAASIGTLGAGLHGALHAGERTTPDVIHVHGILAEFRDAGASHVAMEVSSHALDQRRVDGVRFDVAVFTNLTRDHLDYHGTMEAYGAAKARLFAWPDLRAAVINVDDAFGRELAVQCSRQPGQLLRYALDSGEADVRALDVRLHSEGIDFELSTPWGTGAVHSRLLGRFNVANLLAVAGTLGALEVPFARIREVLEALQPVSGRMSRLGGGGMPLVIVDYSHTPDALEQALKTLRAHCQGELICVFGCGGDRDAGKRPVMGAIAEQCADVAIVTDDNPRSEDGDAIVAQILAGMRAPGRATVERDRARAIGIAVAQAGAGDIVLVAGKGHETYQERGGVKRPFDDLQVARATLEARPC